MTTRRRGLLTNNGFMALLGVAAIMIGTTLPEMIRSFGLTLSRGGLIVSAQSAGGLVAMFAGLLVADRISKPLWILISVGLVGLLLGLAGLAPGYWVLVFVLDLRWSQVWDTLVETPFGLYTTWEKLLEDACGIPALHFHVLQTLASAPDGRLRLLDLAEAVRHSQSGTTRLVDRLEKENLVARHSCESDRRVIWAMLLDKGKSVYEQALPVWNEFLEDHLRKGLTFEEADTLHSLLIKLQGTLKDDAITCPSLATDRSPMLMK